jgi:hypothetical protein
LKICAPAVFQRARQARDLPIEELTFKTPTSAALVALASGFANSDLRRG